MTLQSNQIPKHAAELLGGEEPDVSMERQTMGPVTLTSDAVPILREAAEEMKRMGQGRSRRRDTMTDAIDAAAEADKSNPDARFPIPEIYNEYIDAPEIEAVAKRLIAKHDQFLLLRPGGAVEVGVRYMWRKKGGGSGGKAVLGKCQRLSGLTRVLAEGDSYLIWIAADHTRFYGFTNEQMEALVYHELLHIDLQEGEEEGDLLAAVKGHDAELFNDEIREYGLWKLDLMAMGNAVRQLKLWDQGGAK